MNELASQQNVLGDLDTLDRITRFAELMASGRCTVPKELQNSPGDCLAISLQAAAWQMNPFSVAQKSHVIKGKIGYEAQLINAVITRHAPITGRPQFNYSEGWDRVLNKFKTVQGSNGSYTVPDWKPEDEKGLWCEVSATMVGESEPRVLRLMLSQAQPRLSTQWATDPKQQLSYATLKKWARLHCPDVMLGIYTPEELQNRTPVEKDVTPDSDLKARLKAQGESLAVRTDSHSPPARTENDLPDGEELTSTENTPIEHKQDTTQEDKEDDDRPSRLRQLLREQKQVPLPEVTEDDQTTLQLAVDSIASCKTVDELKECGKDLEGMIHPDLKDQAVKAYKQQMAVLQK
ncbi:recombinase RecT [Endozoicomonas gorgoniicola]|uniref:Recombinase RecT n=1 Tax=Endozoicomonas gorgoniicola TaxID=1234144 RepID=A0ABT3MRW2_9GAMM|nr:RecT family recombinase [Endozoicomonas gorgoniicola]MCW7552106.1 recombinase RecT [Endozoicomonas gorgoniicola]